MDKQEVISQTIHYLSAMSQDKVEEAFDFIEYLYNKKSEDMQVSEIARLATASDSFKFLDDEENLYSASDIKEV